jgi:predicted nucleic acid-binding protein
VIVVDASVLVPGLVDDGRDGDAARVRLRGEVLAAPELVDLEVASVLRRLVLAGSLPLRHADLALADLVELPLQRAAHRSLLARCWQLRSNVTVYDAAYIALAEALGALLVTADARLAAAPGLRCDVELLTA